MAAVLIVEDDEAISDAICMLLEEAGFECQQAANGEEALWQMRSSPQP